MSPWRVASTKADRPPDAAPRDAVPIAAPAAVADAAGKPAPVATKLVASGDSTCAVVSDLTVRCWGGNVHGQLGDGTTADAAAPTTPEIRAVKDLQLVDGTACALLGSPLDSWTGGMRLDRAFVRRYLGSPF